MTHIVNLFAGPGAGKSTLAAGIYAELKARHINCELVTEFAKELVWKEDFKQFENQFYLFGEQHNRIHKLLGKVDVIVTDYPLPLLMLYHNSPFREEFFALLLKIFNSFKNHNYFVNRKHKYSTIGRMHSLEDAKYLDLHTLELLLAYEIPFQNVDGDIKVIPKLCDELLKNIE
jgi:hypothetical protein